MTRAQAAAETTQAIIDKDTSEISNLDSNFKNVFDSISDIFSQIDHNNQDTLNPIDPLSAISI